MPKQPRVAIFGASGFIGSALTRYLLDTTNYRLTLFSHKASKLQFSTADELRITHIDGSVLNKDDITQGLHGCESAVYLVHLMGQTSAHNYETAEERAAHNFGQVAQKLGVNRVVYVGGMANNNSAQPPGGHLRSRQATGEILRRYAPQVIELHTPMVIGRGGVGYDALTWVVDHSPILPLPRWANGRTYPITVDDVAQYIHAALQTKMRDQISTAIGGPELLSYSDVARRYAAARSKKLHVIPLPFISPALSALVLRQLPGHATKALAVMIASAAYNTPASKQLHFKSVKPEPIEQAMT